MDSSTESVLQSPVGSRLLGKELAHHVEVHRNALESVTQPLEALAAVRFGQQAKAVRCLAQRVVTVGGVKNVSLL